MKKHKILVTGAAGQLGSELTPALRGLYGEENVFASDIKYPNSAPSETNFEIVDVLKRKALFTFIKKNRITQVYHLAAALSANGELRPKFTWRLNMDGLMHVMDAAVEFEVDRVFWPSSIAVFGPDSPKNNTPQVTILEPSTMYGITKLAGERLCNWYYHKFGLDVRSIRYPGLIGYRTKPGGGTTDYAVDIYFKAVARKNFVCFLKPDTRLPMMYMADAVKSTLGLMESPSEKIRIRSGYNVSAMSFSPSEVAEEIKKQIPEFAICYQTDFRQAIADSWPNSIDDSYARSDWGWKNQFDLRKMTLDMLKNLGNS